MTQIIDLGKLRFAFAGDWSPTTQYEVNDVVRYGGNVYVYTYALKTVGNLPTDQAYWALLVESLRFRGQYDIGTAYMVGEVVTYGGSIYVAKVDSTGQVPTSTAHWDPYLSGFSFKGDWSNVVLYKLGETVLYGGNVYQANADLVANVNPTVTASWTKLFTGMVMKGEWATATQYKPQEVVSHGGNSYISVVPHASTVFATDLAAGKWTKFNSGIRWRGLWVAATQYLENDLVVDGASTYLAPATYVSGNVSANADYIAGNLQVLARGVANVPDPVGAPDYKVLGVVGDAYALVDMKIKVFPTSANALTKDGMEYALDSSAGSFTMQLPATPTPGMRVIMYDAAETLNRFPVAVDGNGSNIDELPNGLNLDAKGVRIFFTYLNATIGWRTSV